MSTRFEVIRLHVLPDAEKLVEKVSNDYNIAKSVAYRIALERLGRGKITEGEIKRAKIAGRPPKEVNGNGLSTKSAKENRRRPRRSASR